MNNFMMSDMLRICDEFGAWLIILHKEKLFSLKGNMVCARPDFSKIQTDDWYEFFYTFCHQHPDFAARIPADDCTVNMIVRSVFKYCLIGERTCKEIEDVLEGFKGGGYFVK